MLETLREFGAEQLAVACESDELRRRHADLFLELATQAQPRLASAGRQQALEQLEADYDNLRAALAWLANTAADAAACD